MLQSQNAADRRQPGSTKDINYKKAIPGLVSPDDWRDLTFGKKQVEKCGPSVEEKTAQPEAFCTATEKVQKEEDFPSRFSIGMAFMAGACNAFSFLIFCQIDRMPLLPKLGFLTASVCFLVSGTAQLALRLKSKGQAGVKENERLD